MRARLTGFFWFCLVAAASAQGPITDDNGLVKVARQSMKRVLLVPLDDRPASSQFAQMIGKIADVAVETPPLDMLGRFTVPGRSDDILDWIDKKNLGDYDAVIVNTEMICYGGLMASRMADTDYDTAIRRLRSLWSIRKLNPATKFYAFSTIQRIAPTALRNTREWREPLANLVILKSRIKNAPTKQEIARATALRAQIPYGEVERYYAARARNHRVQQELLRMTAQHGFDYLVIGQDDAQPVGPHVAETKRLQLMAENLAIGQKIYFCEGIDQHSNILVSRSLLESARWTPAVKVVFADHIGKGKIAPYESDKVENSLLDQLEASGARVAREDEAYDYALYVNTPEPRVTEFEKFEQSLIQDIDQGFPIAVADINLGTNGTGDPRLYEAMNSRSRAMKLLAYAGWNTAGNTMGTTIPAANVYLAARRFGVDDLSRELNQRAFLLHRLINDFEYHRFTRPQAYAIQDRLGSSKEEIYGTAFDAVNQFVQKDMRERLDRLFRTHFLGQRFFAGTHQYQLQKLEQVSVDLPWPRAYEVRIGFQLDATEVPE